MLLKLQIKRNKNKVNYHISLPKNFVEEIARWRPGQKLEVTWIEKGKHETLNKPYFRISKPDNLWVDKTEE